MRRGEAICFYCDVMYELHKIIKKRNCGYLSQSAGEKKTILVVSVSQSHCHATRKPLVWLSKRLMANEANAHQTLVAGKTEDTTLIYMRLI